MVILRVENLGYNIKARDKNNQKRANWKKTETVRGSANSNETSTDISKDIREAIETIKQ